jgi:HAMP domain-containing protein
MLRWLLSVRGKILVTIFGVSVIVLALGAWAAFRAVTEAKEVGRYLEGPFRHYHGTIDSGDDGAEAVARTLAADPGLTSALASGKSEDIQAAADRLAEPLQGTLTPDWVILSDTAGTTYRVGKFKSLSAEQWREYRSFQDLVKQGSLVKRVGVIAQRPHRIAGAAVRSEGRVVGALLLAESLQTYFWDVADASGERAKDQHRLVLLSRDKVLAKSIKDDEVASFIESFRAPRWISDGRGSVPVLTLDGVDHDYWSEPLYGYERSSDPTTHQVGALVLVKARDQSEQLADTYRGVAVAFLIALVLALSFGYVLAVQITRPLRAYIAATESLARGQGDLSRRLPVQTRDELGSLAQNLNRVFARLSR